MTSVEINNRNEVLQHQLEADIDCWLEAMDEDAYRREVESGIPNTYSQK